MAPQVFTRLHILENFLHLRVLDILLGEYSELTQHGDLFSSLLFLFIADIEDVIFAVQSSKSRQFGTDYGGSSTLGFNEGKLSKAFSFAEESDLTKS